MMRRMVWILGLATLAVGCGHARRPSTATTPETQLERAMALIRRGDFRRATAPGASPDVVRAAFLGLGDVRFAQGDIAGALESYQQALVGGTPGDTIAQRAQEKINSLGKAEPQ